MPTIAVATRVIARKKLVSPITIIRNTMAIDRDVSMATEASTITIDRRIIALTAAHHVTDMMCFPPWWARR